MSDLLDLIRSWRSYRRILDMDARSEPVDRVPIDRNYYQRLIDDLALVIRRRIGQ